MKESNSQAFRRGFRDGIPIGLGYLAVSFSIGIAARNIGLNAFQGFLMSLLNNASAGEYAGLTVIAANSPYIEVAIVTLITNARYLLMSCAMSQRLSPDLSLGHRLLMSYDITDELFGIAISRPRYFKSLLYLWRDGNSASGLGFWNYARCHCRKYHVTAYGQCI